MTKQKPISFSLNWNLDTLFPGESISPTLQSALDHLKHQIQQFKQKFEHISDLKKGILHLQELEGHCQDLQELITCLMAQNVEDQEALKLNSQITALRAHCDSLGEELNALLSGLDADAVASLLADPDLQSIAFNLQERRQNTNEKLPIEQECLVHQLWVDGYQGWNEIYHTFIGQLRIPSLSSSEESLSIGQVSNRLNHPDRRTRAAWFQRWEETWMSHENLVAQILNHLAGFRLNLYDARGWSSVLHEPLLCNRMQEKTLHAMWEVVEKHKNILKKYLASKARLLGIDQLAWHDLEAPLPIASTSTIPFEKAALLIIQHFTAFNPAMGAFARRAFEERWIEAEDRSGKHPGGFCVSFTHKQQSRIFMTYSGTMANVFTLAHELGHAYHNYEVRELPIFAQQYPMNVAETASTLAEMVVIDSMIQQTQDPKTQLILIDNKLQRAVIFLMNIQARFLFELDFYHARRKGFVLADELNFLMEKAQKHAFGNALSEWHPHFWVAKQHFYATEVPFYNFPYTFGYLFSLGIYAYLKRQKEGKETYASLLRDTGRLTVEELAYRHLGVKLEEHLFWEEALKLIEEDVATFDLLTQRL
jgi:pepF/M3 family oligoendopeptidase